MKRLIVSLIGLALFIGVVFLVFYLWAGSVYDKTVSYQETVDQEWADVQAAYQRRADLIPNLVKTVEAAAQTEKDILVEVTEARNGMGAIKEMINNAETPVQLEAAGSRINRAFNIVFERYPEVKSMQNFQMLQTQLEGTENRVNIAREDYNASIKDYNSQVRGFFRKQALAYTEAEGDNFVVREPFEAKRTSEDAPVVEIEVN